MNTIKSVKIATRGSKLAIAQTNLVKEELLKKFPGLKIEVIEIQTKGDKILDTALSKIGDKGLFTKEIEEALLDKRADIAVHSLKDLATEIPAGLLLAAVLKRGEIRDVLIHKKGKKLSELNSDDIIATSSLRRKAALLSFNRDIRITDIRGNVNTRLKKMEDGHCDGMIMAAAGLIRLGLESYITQYLEPGTIMPAVSQGAIAIECCSDDKEIIKLLQHINHPETYKTITAERAFMRKLQGGCQVPVGAFSKLEAETLTFSGFVASTDGKLMIQKSISGPLSDAGQLGEKLAEEIIQLGGREILDNIRNAD